MLKPDTVTRFCSRLPLVGTQAFRVYKRLIQEVSPESVAKTYFGARMVCDARDLIQSYIRFFGVWEPDISATFQDILNPGDLVVDIGANVGYYSLLASRLVGPSGQVVAIEASPRIAEKLIANLELNQTKNVRLEQVAVSDRPQLLTLYSGPDDNWGRTTTIASRNLREDGIVEALPLEKILTPGEISRVRLLKIDIEGAEAPVMRHVLDTIHLFPRKMDLIVEISPYEELESWKAVFNDLIAAGFSARTIHNDYDWHWYFNWSGVAPRSELSSLPVELTDVWFHRE